MGNFLIKPQGIQSRVWDNAFLWNERNIYIMASHRLALWCWLQDDNIYNSQYALIHIDEHTDARKLEAQDEAECINEIKDDIKQIKEFDKFESVVCYCRDYKITGRTYRPFVTYDNFVQIATASKLFKHLYIYSTVGDEPQIPETDYTYKQKEFAKLDLEKNIEEHKGKCIVDIDLDFFDKNAWDPIIDEEEDKLLIEIFQIINENKDNISMITIALNDSEGDQFWEKRQHQMKIIKNILNLEIEIPIKNN